MIRRAVFFLIGLVSLGGLVACQNEPTLAGAGTFGEWAIEPGPIYLLGILLIASFGFAAYVSGRKSGARFSEILRHSLPGFIGLWLPLLASVILLYLFAAIGLVEGFITESPTINDPILTQPQWMVMGIWLIGVWEFMQISRRLTGLYLARRTHPTFGERKCLSLLVIGVAGLITLAINPVALLAMTPLVLWLFIGGRLKWLDLVFFLSGGAAVYALLAYFSLTNGAGLLKIVWYLILSISTGTVGFGTMAIIWGVLAAGLTLVVEPNRPFFREENSGLEPTGP